MPPAPKAASKRRNRGTPKSYGAAEPVVTGEAAQEQPGLGFECHSLVEDMWRALAGSVEAQFFSFADWQRARWELWFANTVLQGGEPTASKWAQVQEGLSALLVSPADKRRAGIELKKATADPDEEAAVVQLAEYQAALNSA